MRILFLCKRQYTGRDLLDDRYGRLYELPLGLASRGHAVTVVASSYRRRGRLDRVEHGVRWLGHDVVAWPPAIPHGWHAAVRDFQPDVILASSDAPHLVLAARLARSAGLPFVLDLYDDYEAFALTRLPGLRPALRSACIAADAVLSISHALAAMLPGRGVDVGRIHILGNGVPIGFAGSLSKTAARERLGLAGDAVLVGTAGALTAARGIADLLDAVGMLRAQRPDLRLVIAGPRDHSLAAALPEGTIDLGHLPHAEVAILFRALDVGVVCNRDGAFARACHPMKLVEMAAVGTPVVAADIGEVSHLLADRPDARYPAGEASILAARIVGQLDRPCPLDPSLAIGWATLAAQLDGVLGSVVELRRREARGSHHHFRERSEEGDKDA